MISSCQLIPLVKKGQELDGFECELHTKKKKTKLISPDFRINYYVFRVRSSEEYSALYIELNELESFWFRLVDVSEGVYIFESERIKAKEFLKFNLGIYNLSLLYGESDTELKRERLCPLRNTQSLLNDQRLDYMHQSVVDSDFFRLFMSGILRANTRAELVPYAGGSDEYWLRIYLAREFILFIDQILDRKQRLLSRVRSVSVLREYSPTLDLEPKDIDWLSQNPQHASRCYSGGISAGRNLLNIQKIQQSVTEFTYDIYENRLISFTLLLMANYFGRKIQDSKGASNSPVKATQDMYDLIQVKLKYLMNLYGLKYIKPQSAELSPLFIDDPFYSKGFYLMSLWLSLRDTSLGDQFIAPIPGVTKIFEYYCTAHVIEALLECGFEERARQVRSESEIELVTLSRGADEVIQIFYEPLISQKVKDEKFPISKSHPTNKLPDMVVVYTSSSGTRAGVIDPKFTSDGQIKKLSEDIFYKYGLFFHKDDGSYLDYVVSIYPNVKTMANLTNFRDGMYANSARPFLGILSIPMDSKEMPSFYDELRHFIIG